MCVSTLASREFPQGCLLRSFPRPCSSFNKQPITVGDIMKRKQLHIFADKVAAMLLENPKGLSSYEIYNRLADDRSNIRYLPARNNIGQRLSSIVGLWQAGTDVGYSLTNTRRVVLWRLDIERFNEWRFGDEQTR